MFKLAFIGRFVLQFKFDTDDTNAMCMCFWFKKGTVKQHQFTYQAHRFDVCEIIEISFLQL